MKNANCLLLVICIFVLDNFVRLLKTFFFKKFAYVVNIYYLCTRFRALLEMDPLRYGG